MRMICVDDEAPVLERTLSLCRALPQVDEAVGFQRADSALAWLEEHPAFLALLDINLPDMNGLLLAAKIRERRPDMKILFLTASPQYAVEAFSLHADGYLLKPAEPERLAAEIRRLLFRREAGAPEHIYAQTFGSFDLFVDGEMVSFRRSRAKELLACLIDRQGGSLTRAELFSLLYGDMVYSLSMQKQLDVIIRSLRDTLREYAVSEILERKRGSLRVRPETFACDLYRFLAGDARAVSAYRGVYMSSYSWASLTEGRLTLLRQGD